MTPPRLPLTHPAWWIATGLGIGKIRYMPGTFGSLLGLFIAHRLFVCAMDIAAHLHRWVPHISIWDQFSLTLFGFCLVTFLIGWWASAVYQKRTEIADPKEVVIDEVAGMMLVLYGALPIHFFLRIDGTFTQLLVIGLQFALFRFCDIIKPWPISWVDTHIKGGIGIMLDDICAACVSLLFFYSLMLCASDMGFFV